MDMAEADIARVRELFNGALELSGPERGAFLAGACGGDAALKAKVEGLLAAAERDDEFLASATASAPEWREGGAAPVRERAGTTIGPYKLLQVIGEGGFGTV